MQNDLSGGANETDSTLISDVVKSFVLLLVAGLLFLGKS